MKKMMNRLHATMLFLFGMMILMSCDNSDNPDSPQGYAGNCRYQIAGDDAWAAAMLEKVRSFNRIH